MEHTIQDTGYSDLLSVQLYEDEAVLAQEQSLASYSGSIETTTKTSGTKTDTFKRFMTSTAQFPMVNAKAQTNSTLIFSPPLHATIEPVKSDSSLIVQSLAFLATSSENTVNLDTDVAGLDDISFVEVSGERNLYMSGLGGIESLNLQEGESTKVHVDFVAGYESTVTRDKMKRRKVGVSSKLFGREPTPVYKFRGPGAVYIHARSPLVMSATTRALSGDE